MLIFWHHSFLSDYEYLWVQEDYLEDLFLEMTIIYVAHCKTAVTSVC